MRFFIIIFSLISFSAFAQPKDTIAIIHSYSPEGLELKWLPRNHTDLFYGIKNGYDLYRAEVTQTQNGGQVLGTYQKLNTAKILPWSQQQIEAEINEPDIIENINDLLQTAASPGTAANAAEAVELQQEMGFLTFAGTVSVLLSNKFAQSVGMYFVDKNADPSKRYIYKLEVGNNSELTSYLLVLPSDNREKEQIHGMNYLLRGNTVYINWHRTPKSGLLYYNIYRSDKKNKGFVKLNTSPFIQGTGNVGSENMVSYLDTFPQFNQTFYYKVVGVDAFEREGQFSETMEVFTQYHLKHIPQITESIGFSNSDIKLAWSVSPEDEPYIKGYSIMRSSSGEGDFKKVHEGLISAKNKSYIDQSPKSSSNYYLLYAHGTAGDSLQSIMKAQLLVDSIPPVQPIVVEGKCDTSGIVTLRWKQNPDEDLLGYRVFRTLYQNHEPIRMTESHIYDTVFVDTIDVSMPYNFIYYRVAAIDQNLNASIPSDYFEVKIPDNKPPTNGFFTNYKVSMQGIELWWENSVAYDLKYMYLMRKSDFDFDYVTILKLSSDSLRVKHHLDTSTRSNTLYRYALVAEDENGLRSELSKEYELKQIRKEKIPAVSNLKTIVSQDNKLIKLTWDFPANATGFRIYRSENDGDLQTYKFAPGNKREFYDDWLKPNTKYRYLIIAELPGNFKSGPSNLTEIDY